MAEGRAAAMAESLDNKGQSLLVSFDWPWLLRMEDLRMRYIRMIANRVKEFEDALRNVKRSRKYGRFFAHRYKNGRFNLFEIHPRTQISQIRVEFGSISDCAEVLAVEYKGKP